MFYHPSLTDYLTDIHNYEFRGKTPPNLSILKFTLVGVYSSVSFEMYTVI